MTRYDKLFFTFLITMSLTMTYGLIQMVTIYSKLK